MGGSRIVREKERGSERTCRTIYPSGARGLIRQRSAIRTRALSHHYVRVEHARRDGDCRVEGVDTAPLHDRALRRQFGIDKQ